MKWLWVAERSTIYLYTVADMSGEMLLFIEISPSLLTHHKLSVPNNNILM
jgi:hypothetical protein